MDDLAGASDRKGNRRFKPCVINGVITLTNTGSGIATIGNIVVNLQTKGSKWVTRSSDVADATNGDAATMASVMPKASSENFSLFTENEASGHLLFMDAGTNMILPLVPQIIIAPGEIRSLLFSASFDNNVLGLAAGTPTRAEVIVTFGNAAMNRSSAQNIDINGNDVIDPDEHWVRSVPTRLTLTVPAEAPGNQTVTLSDTVDDITATGTVTFSNAQFNLGATSGTVTVSYDAGADGGTITNCAHLTTSGIDGLDLEACDTQTIGAPPPCTPGAPGCGWEAGDMMTFNQSQWGDPASSAGVALAAHYNSVYMGTVLEVGISGSGGFSTIFTAAAAVLTYLPVLGSIGTLTSDLVDPGSTSSGVFGGEVVALELNVAYSDAGFLAGTSHLGDLRICGFAALPVLNGLTVKQFLSGANTVLGGGSAAFNLSQATTIANFINGAFADGNPSVFAQNNLVNGACPWQAGDMTTYNQSQWGDPSSTAGTLLGVFFDAVYVSGLEVGIPGTSGFSMTFTLADAVLGYLPAIGIVGTLSADLVDPASSSSGAFGGNVAALALNIDFSDMAILPGSSALGDLRICSFTLLPAVNGQTVRQLLGTANTILGGGGAAFGAEEASGVASLINNSFVDGNPSMFAQNNLVNGACGPWEPGQVITHTQSDWGDPAMAGAILSNNYDDVYASTFGVLEVGIPDAGGFSISFLDYPGVLAYLPQPGAAGALTADHVNPTSSSAGVFGGEVVALQLNVDFSDANVTLGSAGIPVGDLRVCGTSIGNSLTIREVLDLSNTALGGGASISVITSLNTLVEQINGAFSGGNPNVFAQNNLVNGACP